MNKLIAVLVAAALAVVVGVLYVAYSIADRERANLSRVLGTTSEEARTLADQVAALSLSNASMNQAILAAQSQTSELRAQLVTNVLLLTELTNRMASTTNVVPRPHQVRAFLGTQSVGLAWIIPSNVRRDPKTGLVSYEQVVALPDAARGSITAFVTNVVEQPVPAEPNVVQQHNYIDQRHFDQRYPWLWPSTIVYPPVEPMPPIAPIPPTAPNPHLQRGGLYRPPSERGDPGLYVPPGLR